MEVAVFWDYENVRCPRHLETSEVMQCVTSTVLEMPNVERISRFNVYYDSRKTSEEHTDRLGLSELGANVVDCPSRGAKQKETVDKKLIVDAMQFGMSARERPLGVVLVTGDGDFAYLLSRLRQTRVFTAVLFGTWVTTAKILLSACDVSFSLYERLPPPPEGPFACVPEEAAAAAPPAADDCAPKAAAAETEDSSAVSVATDAGLLTFLFQVHRQGQGWVADAQAAGSFYGSQDGGRSGASALYRQLRGLAADNGCVEIGRRDPRTQQVVQPSEAAADVPTSWPIYLRLTADGKSMLEEEDEPLDTADWLSLRSDGTHVCGLCNVPLTFGPNDHSQCHIHASGAKHKRNAKQQLHP